MRIIQRIIEQAILVAHTNQFVIALSTFVSNESQVWIASLAVSAHNTAIIVQVVLEELLSVVIGIDIDLSECIVYSWILVVLVDTGLQEWQKQFHAVAFFDLFDKLIETPRTVRIICLI